MTDGTAEATRRGFLAAAAGGAAVAGSAGIGAAQENGNETDGGDGQTRPDFGGYLDDANLFDGTVADMRGESEVTVNVGAGNGLAFDPPAIHVDAGTTVVWEWTGQGGSHNVVAQDGSFGSDLTAEEGATFEQTFDADGVFTYFCEPHKAAGMKGAIVVGDEYPTTTVEAGGGGGGGDGGSEGEGDGGDGGGGGGGEPDFGGYLDDAAGYDGSVVDLRGEEEPTVTVGGSANGGLSFEPPAVHVDNGATVVWEWSGEGGSHNVVANDGSFESELTGEAGFTFEQTFEEDGIYNYYCEPHEAAGMLGSVVVGSDYPSVDTGGGGGGGGGPQQLPESVMTLAVATTLVTSATLGLAYVFIKFGGAAPDDS